MLKRIARTSYRRRWRVLAAWIVLLVGLIVAEQHGRRRVRNEFSLSGSESQEAFDLLEEQGLRRSGRLHRPDRVQGRRRRRRPPGAGRRWNACSPQVENTVPPGRGRQPVRVRRCAPDRRRRSDRLRGGELRRPARRRLLRRRRRDQGAGPGRRRRGRRRSSSAATSSPTSRCPAQRGDRDPPRDRHPAGRVRLGARGGPADHDGAVRHRHRHRARAARRQRAARCPTSPRRPWR